MSEAANSTPVNSSSSALTASRTNRTASFSDFMARASGEETQIVNQRNQLHEQTAIRENGAQKAVNQAQSAAPVREDRSEWCADSNVDSNRNSTAGNQDAGQSEYADRASGDATLTISVSGSGDNVKVSVDGLSAQLLKAVLAACSTSTEMIQLVGNAKAEQQLSSQDDKTDNAQGTGKVTSTVALDASDLTNAAKEVLAILQGLIEALQDKTQNRVTLQLDVGDASNTKADDARILEGIYDGVRKGISGASPQTQSANQAYLSSVNQASTMPLRDFLSQLSTQASPTNADQPGNLKQSVSSDGAPDAKPVNETGVNLAELVISKIKAAVTLPDIAEAAPNTGEKETNLQSEQGASSFAGQSASAQAPIQHQEGPPDASSAASFGSIVADRLAAVAEQVGTREKPSDITLRLRTETGESLMVGLKDQAGKIVVQVKSADQNLVGFLESQKETIVRNLEAKQVASTISVSPIEEDLTRRQPREQQSRNAWGKRREPANPFIETSA